MKRWASMALVSLLLTLTAAGQGQAGGAPQGGNQGGGSGGAASNPVGRIGSMDDAERRRTLENLPPERRKQAEERMEKLDRMSPAEREQVARSYAAFQRLPVKMQERARNMYRSLNALPADRHAALRTEFSHLRGESSAERTQTLKNKEFKKRYSKKEQAILSDYVALLEAPLR